MLSALSVAFYVTHRGMMEHLPRLNHCNFKNVIVKSIIRVRAEVTTAVPCLLIMNKWPDKLTETSPEYVLPRQARVPHMRFIIPHLPGQSWPNDVWWLPSVVTIRCISYCANNEIYGRLRINFVHLLGTKAFSRCHLNVQPLWGDFLDLCVPSPS